MKELLKNAENMTLTDEQLNLENIFTICLPMPARIRGYTEKFDFYYFVYINEILCEQCRKQAIIHELTHIFKNDFDRSDPVEIIEDENRD